jgi:hypothetical protein
VVLLVIKITVVRRGDETKERKVKRNQRHEATSLVGQIRIEVRNA